MTFYGAIVLRAESETLREARMMILDMSRGEMDYRCAMGVHVGGWYDRR